MPEIAASRKMWVKKGIFLTETCTKNVSTKGTPLVDTKKGGFWPFLGSNPPRGGGTPPNDLRTPLFGVLEGLLGGITPLFVPIEVQRSPYHLYGTV